MTPKKEGSVTFNRRVARILQNRCQECHRPGQVGPMSLLTYEDALAWQKFPVEEAKKVLTSFDQLQAAYKSEDASQFAEASRAFFTTLKQVSERTTLEGLMAAHQPQGLIDADGRSWRPRSNVHLAARGAKPACGASRQAMHLWRGVDVVSAEHPARSRTRGRRSG